MTKHLKTLILLGGILLNCGGVYGKNTITVEIHVEKNNTEIQIINKINN